MVSDNTADESKVADLFSEQISTLDATAFSAELDEANEEIGSLKAQLERCQDVDELLKQLATSQQEMTDAMSKAASCDAELTTCKSALTSAQLDATYHGTRYTAMVNDRTKDLENIKTAEALTMSTDAARQEASDARDRAESTVSTLRSQLQDAHSQLGELEYLRAEHEQLQIEKGNLTKEVATATELSSELQRKIDSMAGSATQREIDADVAVQGMRLKCSNAVAEVTDLRSKFSTRERVLLNRIKKAEDDLKLLQPVSVALETAQSEVTRLDGIGNNWMKSWKYLVNDNMPQKTAEVKQILVSILPEWDTKEAIAKKSAVQQDSGLLRKEAFANNLVVQSSAKNFASLVRLVLARSHISVGQIGDIEEVQAWLGHIDIGKHEYVHVLLGQYLWDCLNESLDRKDGMRLACAIALIPQLDRMSNFSASYEITKVINLFSNYGYIAFVTAVRTARSIDALGTLLELRSEHEYGVRGLLTGMRRLKLWALLVPSSVTCTTVQALRHDDLESLRRDMSVKYLQEKTANGILTWFWDENERSWHYNQMLMFWERPNGEIILNPPVEVEVVKHCHVMDINNGEALLEVVSGHILDDFMWMFFGDEALAAQDKDSPGPLQL
jgi:hypothetical protein